MSLSVSGTWLAGVWDTTVWASGVWLEGSTGPVVADGAGNLDWRKVRPRKKKQNESVVIRYSDFDSQEAYAQALAAASVPIARITEAGELPEDSEIDGDDEILETLFMARIIQ